MHKQDTVAESIFKILRPGCLLTKPDFSESLLSAIHLSFLFLRAVFLLLKLSFEALVLSACVGTVIAFVCCACEPF